MKLRDKIAEAVFSHTGGNDVNGSGRAADAILSVIAETVEPLEWLGGGGRWHAGDYVIEDVSHGQREVRRLLRASFGTTYISDFSGEKPLKAAMDAAQADYNRRILSALGLIDHTSESR